MIGWQKATIITVLQQQLTGWCPCTFQLVLPGHPGIADPLGSHGQNTGIPLRCWGIHAHSHIDLCRFALRFAAPKQRAVRMQTERYPLSADLLIPPDTGHGQGIPGWGIGQNFCILFDGMQRRKGVIPLKFHRCTVRFCQQKTAFGERSLISGAVMAPFYQVFDHAWDGYFLVLFCMLGFGICHMLYYRQDAKSIYTMRRLPDRISFIRYTWTLTVCEVMICLLFALGCLLVSFWMYCTVTPPECLPDGQWSLFWENLFTRS